MPREPRKNISQQDKELITEFMRYSTCNYWWNQLWSDESGQDVAEYSVMLAVILVIVVGTVRLIGSNAGNIFSQVGSSIQ
jgi:Flp pilus assembly pilin Flp